jgi:hypothetical protein
VAALIDFREINGENALFSVMGTQDAQSPVLVEAVGGFTLGETL